MEFLVIVVCTFDISLHENLPRGILLRQLNEVSEKADIQLYGVLGLHSKLPKAWAYQNMSTTNPSRLSSDEEIVKEYYIIKQQDSRQFSLDNT